MYKKKTRSIEFGFIYFDFIHSEPVKLIMNRCLLIGSQSGTEMTRVRNY